MKRMLCGFAVLTLLLALQSQGIAKKTAPPPPPPPLPPPPATDTYVVFYATGYFVNGDDELTGTVTIDTTTGQAVSADLAVVDGFGNEVAVFGGTPMTGRNVRTGRVEIAVGNEISAAIVLVTESMSLQGYAGGSLLPTVSFWAEGYEYPSINYLYYGSLEP